VVEQVIDFYALLGVPPTASQADVQHALRQAIRTWSKQTARPELDRRHAAERTMRHLREAREVLLDPQRRQEYDRMLAARGPAGAPVPDGEDSQDWLELARRALATADYRTALRAAEEVATPSARSVEVWNILAQANAGLGRFDEAVFQAHRAVHLDPTNLEHRYTLASCYEGAQDWRNALLCYQQLASADPNSVVPQVGMASVCLSSGDAERAVQLLDELYHRGVDREMVGDYLAAAYAQMAEETPRQRDGDSYMISSNREIDRMRGLLDRALVVAHDPGLISELHETRAYVDYMDSSEFVWRRLFGVWARRYLTLVVALFCAGGLASGLTGSSGMLTFATVVAIAGAVGLVFYARVPRWRFNRAAVTGRHLTY
jgi:Flp pilus assembly protein TadD